MITAKDTENMVRAVAGIDFSKAVQKVMHARANKRTCAHPAGCELLAAPGEIYCDGCGTDPLLGTYDEVQS
jgi:hypothetical protein